MPESHVTVELLGVLERLAGAATMELQVSAHTPTVASVLAELVRRFPDLAATVERSACAMGDTLVTRATALPAGARLALLPPVAGG